MPYIYEDRLAKEDFVNALVEIHNMTHAERHIMGLKGREHVVNNYNFDKYCNGWVELIDKTIEKHGSWENRKTYKSWYFTEIQ